MFNSLTTLIVIASAIFLSGCSTAGPFVTNISSNGDGSITLEKCMIQYNGFSGTVSNKDCIQSNITIISKRMFDKIDNIE